MTLSRCFRLVVIMLLSFSCYAGERFSQVNEWSESGNKYYSKGDYKRAVECYERIMGTGFVNETVYYNLANAYFKNNEIGKAILLYEKALKLAPHDPEILGNLTMARSRIADKVDTPYQPLWLKQLHRFLIFFSLDSETKIAIALYLSGHVLFSIYLLTRNERIRRYAFHTSLVVGILFLIIAALNSIRIYDVRSTHEGIILVEKVDVLSGPDTGNSTLFSIHEGLKVRVQHELGDWLMVSLDNGWSGWVQKAVLGII